MEKSEKKMMVMMMMKKSELDDKIRDKSPIDQNYKYNQRIYENPK